MNRKWSERRARWTKRRLVTLVVVFVLVGGMVLLTRPLDSGTGPTVTEPVAASETTVVEPPPGVQIGEQQTVETSLGNWVWSRVDTLLDPTDVDEISLPSSTLPEVPLPPQIDGMAEWRVRTGEDPFPHLFPHSNRFGDVTITAVPVAGRVDWSRLYLSDDGWVEARWQSIDCLSEPASVCPEQNPVLEIHYTADRREVVALLEATVVSGDLEAVEFRDQDMGELVLRLEATDEVSAEMLLRAAGCPFFRCGLSVWKLVSVWRFYVENDDPGWIDPPWLGIPVDELVITVGGEGFVLVGVEYHHPSTGRGRGGTDASPAIHTWGSLDGVTWEELRPVQTVDVPLGWQDIGLLVDRDLLVLAFDDGGPYIPRRVWASSDRSGWQQAQLDVRGVEKSLDALTRTSSGWVLLIHGRSGVPGPKGARCEVWVSANGVNWEQISPPPDSRKANVARCFIDDGTVGLITEHVTSVVPRESYDTYWRGTFEE